MTEAKEVIDWFCADTAVLETCSANDDSHCVGCTADLSCADIGPVDSVTVYKTSEQKICRIKLPVL